MVVSNKLLLFLKEKKKFWLIPMVAVLIIFIMILIAGNLSLIKSLKNSIPPGLNYFPN